MRSTAKKPMIAQLEEFVRSVSNDSQVKNEHNRMNPSIVAWRGIPP